MTAQLDGDRYYLNTDSVSQSIAASFRNKKAAAIFVKKLLMNADLDAISQLIMTTYWDISGGYSVTIVTITCSDDTYEKMFQKLRELSNT